MHIYEIKCFNVIGICHNVAIVVIYSSFFDYYL